MLEKSHETSIQILLKMLTKLTEKNLEDKIPRNRLLLDGRCRTNFYEFACFQTTFPGFNKIEKLIFCLSVKVQKKDQKKYCFQCKKQSTFRKKKIPSVLKSFKKSYGIN